MTKLSGSQSSVDFAYITKVYTELLINISVSHTINSHVLQMAL